MLVSDFVRHPPNVALNGAFAKAAKGFEKILGICYGEVYISIRAGGGKYPRKRIIFQYGVPDFAGGQAVVQGVNVLVVKAAYLVFQLEQAVKVVHPLLLIDVERVGQRRSARRYYQHVVGCKHHRRGLVPVYHGGKLIVGGNAVQVARSPLQVGGGGERYVYLAGGLNTLFGRSIFQPNQAALVRGNGVASTVQRNFLRAFLKVSQRSDVEHGFCRFALQGCIHGAHVYGKRFVLFRVKSCGLPVILFLYLAKPVYFFLQVWRLLKRYGERVERAGVFALAHAGLALAAVCVGNGSLHAGRRPRYRPLVIYRLNLKGIGAAGVEVAHRAGGGGG